MIVPGPYYKGPAQSILSIFSHSFMPHLSKGNEAGFSGITDKSGKEFRTPVK